jgi:hypothetical protein
MIDTKSSLAYQAHSCIRGEEETESAANSFISFVFPAYDEI